MSGSISTAAGDDLDRFMSEHHSGVVRTVAVACGDVVLAHDAVHEALARALEQANICARGVAAGTDGLCI